MQARPVDQEDRGRGRLREKSVERALASDEPPAFKKRAVTPVSLVRYFDGIPIMGIVAENGLGSDAGARMDQKITRRVKDTDTLLEELRRRWNESESAAKIRATIAGFGSEDIPEAVVDKVVGSGTARSVNSDAARIFTQAAREGSQRFARAFQDPCLVFGS